MKKNIIYGLLDPRPHKLGHLRYVGKSEQGVGRFKEHLRPSSLDNNLPKDNWIKKLKQLGMTPEFLVLECFDTPDVLFEQENFYIIYYRSLGCDLLNMTDGGDGTRGYKHTKATIELMKEKAKVRDTINYQNPHNKKDIILINGEQHRHCVRCNDTPKLHLFVFNKKQNKYGSYCKKCRREHQAEYKRKNPSPKLSKEAYLASHMKAITAGGEAMKRPEQRARQALARSKPIQATSLSTTEVLTFPSALAAKASGFQNSNIGQAIKFKTPYRGYLWKFSF